MRAGDAEWAAGGISRLPARTNNSWRVNISALPVYRNALTAFLGSTGTP
jgi:hypothetical protein